MRGCKFNVGDYVFIGDAIEGVIMRGVVIKTEYVDTRSITAWVIDVNPYYYFSNVEQRDVGGRMCMLTYIEDHLEIDIENNRDDKLNKLGI